jgi:excisionase family DNA binding protein
MKPDHQNEIDDKSPRHLALGIEDVCRESGLGRTTIYAAIKAGHLSARKYGRRTIVLFDDLSAFLRGLPTTKSGGMDSAGREP